MRKRGRVDENQTKVVEHLRRAGLSVAVTSSIGNGFPDLVVAGWGNVAFTGKRYCTNKTVLVELKNPDVPKSGQRLTEDEIKFMDTWKGEYIKATSAEEILKHF